MQLCPLLLLFVLILQKLPRKRLHAAEAQKEKNTVGKVTTFMIIVRPIICSWYIRQLHVLFGGTGFVENKMRT